MSSEPSDERPWGLSPASFLASLGLLALALALAVWRLEPPAPLESDAPAERFSAGRALEILQRLLPEEVPHPVGSQANRQLRLRLEEELRRLGLQPLVQRGAVADLGSRLVWVENLAARIEGSGDGRALLLVAHYDSVPAGPGVSDDAMSLAALLETARVLLREAPLRNTVILLFTDGEEAGLLGAQLFAERHPWAQQVGFVLNLEAAGTAGRSMLFETSPDNAWLADAYAASASSPETSSVHVAVYQQFMPSRTDLSVFLQRGLAGANLAINRHQMTHYHSPMDDFAHLDMGSLQHQGDNALALARNLAARDLGATPAGDAVFVDLMGWVLPRWSPGSGVVAAALCLGLLLAVALALARWRRRALPARALLAGLGGWLLVLVLSAGAGLGLCRLFEGLMGQEGLLYGPQAALRCALWLGVLVTGGAGAALLGRWAGAAGLALGSWIGLSALTLGLALGLPGVSAPFLVPAVLATLCLGLLCLPRRRPLWEVAVVLPALGAMALWAEFALVLEGAFGLGEFVLAPLVLVAGALSPLFAVQGVRRLPWSVLGLGALAALAAGAYAWGQPRCSEQRPRTLNLHYLEQPDLGQAHWISRQRVDAGLREVAGFSGSWTQADDLSWGYLATAEPQGLPAPQLELLERRERDGWRRLRLRLRSRRAASYLSLELPRHAQLASITAEEQRLVPDKWQGGWQVLQFLGLPPEGVELELLLKAEDPLRARLRDASWGLPAAGQELERARAPLAVPRNWGDRTEVVVDVEL